MTGKLGVVVAVSRPEGVGLAGFHEALFAVLADRLQQSVARAFPCVVGNHEVMGNQTRQQLEDVVGLDRLARAHHFGSFQGAPSRKHRKPVEEPLLGRGEKVVGPVDGGAQCLLPFDRDAPTATEEPEPPVESPRQFTGVHRADPRGRELDRQRHAVEAPAHLHDSVRVGRVQLEARLHGASPIHEQAHRLALAQRRHIHPVFGHRE